MAFTDVSTAVSRRLGSHHFAYLRAVAEGVPCVDAARRYLAVDHGAEALQAHRLVVDRVQAVARRRGDSRWRLIGLELPAHSDHVVPPLHEWAAACGLDDWAEAELQALHADTFAQALSAVDPRHERRLHRLARLRSRRLSLLRELEVLAAEQAAASDLLEGWLPPAMSEQLRRCGLLTLGDLHARIGRGGRWWQGLVAFGPVKAARLRRHVELLLGAPASPAWPLVRATTAWHALDGRRGGNRVIVDRPGIAADDDRQAIHAWIASRAGSPHTARQYEREADRFVLWCVLERGKAMSDAGAEECRAYMDFISDVPERWISRCKVNRLAPGWAPFRGPLGLASQRVAIDTLNALFGWLVQARYLASNPWVLVNRRLGDDPDAGDADTGSRAFTPAAWAALRAHLDAAAPSASNARLRWLCTFMEATGLRAAELVRAVRGDLTQRPAGWVLRVHGKGRRNRSVPVPATAIDATRAYFARRGLSLDSAADAAPLLASVVDPLGSVTYRALHETMTRFVRRALKSSDLPVAERDHAMRASTHWLRHTHATRAAEREVPPDILQENLGQSDPRTTARYYRAQMERRQRAMEKAFAGP